MDNGAPQPDPPEGDQTQSFVKYACFPLGRQERSQRVEMEFVWGWREHKRTDAYREPQDIVAVHRKIAVHEYSSRMDLFSNPEEDDLELRFFRSRIV